jgi:hypothetical protein
MSSLLDGLSVDSEPAILVERLYAVRAALRHSSGAELQTVELVDKVWLYGDQISAWLPSVPGTT